MQNVQWNAHKRAGVVVDLLRDGRQMTTAEIAEILGMTYHGALYLMDNLSGAPICITLIKGRWQIVDFDDSGL